MPRRKKRIIGKGGRERQNGQFLRPEGFSDDEVESFDVHGVDGISSNEGNVS